MFLFVKKQRSCDSFEPLLMYSCRNTNFYLNSLTKKKLENKAKLPNWGRWRLGRLNKFHAQRLVNPTEGHKGTTTRPCLGLPCCAGWTSWSSWTACDESCFDPLTGSFKQEKSKRTRSCGCKDGGAKVDFSLCPSNSSFIDERNCPERLPCPFWSAWSQFSLCSVSCAEYQNGTCSNVDGIRTRQRSCINGNIGQGECTNGDEIEKLPCESIPSCCQYQSWSEWAEYHGNSDIIFSL